MIGRSELKLELGLCHRIRRLIWIYAFEAGLLIITLTMLAWLLNAGRYLGATGLQGVALFVMRQENQRVASYCVTFHSIALCPTTA